MDLVSTAMESSRRISGRSHHTEILDKQNVDISQSVTTSAQWKQNQAYLVNLMAVRCL